MSAFTRVFRTALFELASALRSRRAVVTVLLFALIGAGVMYATVSVFSTMEEQVVSMLGLPAAENPGGVTMTLWRSPFFKSIMAKALGSSLLFDDMLRQHPVALAFGFFLFAVMPVMTLITCAPTAAGEIRAGSVRYVLLRVSRTEWTFGFFFAEALVLLSAMLLLAVAASVVAVWRLPEWSALAFLPALFSWALRAWISSLAWLGICTGVSLCVRSPGKATGLSLLAFALTVVFGFLSDRWSPLFGFLRPQGYELALWRSSSAVVFEGVVGTLALAFLYLGLGGAVFARRDV